jgi:hypothetical protein
MSSTRSFVIIPPRQIVSGLFAGAYVSTLNGMSGALTLTAGPGVSVTPQPLTQGLRVDFDSTMLLRKNVFSTQGDRVSGNIRFAPGDGSNAYGLAIWATPTPPSGSTGITGAICYDTTEKVMLIHDNGSWLTLAQTGALTRTEADNTYLRLDGSNIMQGNLRLGNNYLVLRTSASSPVAGPTGSLVYRSDLGRVEVYDGVKWMPAGTGVSLLEVGYGLIGTPTEITSEGRIDLDTSNPIRWDNTQEFHSNIVFKATSSVTFEGDVQLPVNKLYSDTEDLGDIIRYGDDGWENLAIGSEGQVLTVSATGVPVWDDSSGSSSDTIGEPTPPPTGNPVFFEEWDEDYRIPDGFRDLNELLVKVAPEKPNDLEDLVLILSGVNTATVKLSAGLPGAWYPTGKVAGDSISGYFYEPSSITASTPNASGAFFTGYYGKESTYGILTHKKYLANSGTQAPTIENSINLVTTPLPHTDEETNSDLTVAISLYQRLWASGNADVVYTHLADGYEAHTIESTISGESSKLELYYDPASNSSPQPNKHAGYNIELTSVTPQTKYLSGVAYYAYNSEFKCDFVVDSGLFDRCYNATRLAVFVGSGLDGVSVAGSENVIASPSTPPHYQALYVRMDSNPGLPNSVYDTAVPLKLTVPNSASYNKLSVRFYKAFNTSASSRLYNIDFPAGPRAITTFGDTSTDSDEFFTDEARRLVLDTNTSWTASNALTAGNSQIRPATLSTAGYWGDLCHPNKTLPNGLGLDYGSFGNSVPTQYQRWLYFSGDPRKNGVLNFFGLQLTDITAYGVGEINVLIKLDSPSNLYWDLGVEFGTCMALDGVTLRDGLTPTTAYGTRISSSSTGTFNDSTWGEYAAVAWNIGTYSTQTHSDRVRLCIYHRNHTAKSIKRVRSL